MFQEGLDGQDLMCFVVFHSADGTDESAMGAGGIDADHVHDFAGVEAVVGAVDVLERVLFDIAGDRHAKQTQNGLTDV